MKKWEKLKGKMQNSLMEKWTEIEKINKKNFSSSKNVVHTINSLSVLQVQAYTVEGIITTGQVVKIRHFVSGDSRSELPQHILVPDNKYFNSCQKSTRGWGNEYADFNTVRIALSLAINGNFCGYFFGK